MWLFLSFLVSLSLSMSHEHAAVKMSSFKHSILIFHPILCLQCQCSTILCEAQDVLGQAGTLSQALLPLTSFCPRGWRGGVSRIGCTSTYVHGRAPSPTIWHQMTFDHCDRRFTVCTYIDGIGWIMLDPSVKMVFTSLGL